MSVKISELPILDSLADNDVIAGVDTSANVTSKIEMATLKNYIDTNTQYTAGKNINITNNVISAPFVYDKTQTNALLDDFKDETNASIEDLKDETDTQIEELQSEVDSLSTIFNAFPTESGEGESLTLDDTAEVKFKKFDLKGNTSQTTYSGKNLFDKDDYINDSWASTRNGWVLNLEPGTYTLSANVKLRMIKGSEHNSTGWGNVKFGAGNAKANTFTFSISENFNQYLWMSYTDSSDNEVSITKDNISSLNVMLEKGSSATEFEPYVGATASPNPSYPQPVNVVSGDNEINVVGKNIFDGVIEQGSYDASTGANTGSDVFYRNANKIPVLPSTTYTFSINGVSQRYVVLFYQANGTFISQNASLTTGTFTTPSNAYYVNFRCFQSDYTSDYATLKVQLEKSSSATTYEPYSGNLYEIDLRIGKNLFDINTIVKGYELNSNTGKTQENTNWWLSDYIAIKPNTNYTNSNISSDTKCWYDKYKNFISRVQSRTGTSPANAKYLRVNGTLASLESNPQAQIEEGNDVTTFETYNSIELCKIGNYQDYFGKSDGRNLFDKSSIEEGKRLGSDGLPFDDTSFDLSDYIKVDSNTQYTYSRGSNGSGSSAIAYYDSSKTFISRTMPIMDSNAREVVLTTPNNATYVRIADLKTALDSMQFEKGSSASDYQPYGVGKWYLHKEIGKVVLNGNSQEIWTKSGATTESAFVGAFNLHLSGIGNKYATGSTWFCDKFTYGSLGVDYKYNTYNGDATSGYMFFALTIPISLASDINAFRTWLGNNNVKLYYVLKEATITEITYQPLIDQLNLIEKALSKQGQTNVSQVNNDKPFIITAEAIKDLGSVLDRIELLES